MITVIDPEEYIPSGQEASAAHPLWRVQPVYNNTDGIRSAGRTHPSSAVSPPKQGRWCVCESPLDSVSPLSEELYIDGCVLYSSRLLGRRLSFTMDSPIVSALRCNFTSSASRHVLEEDADVERAGELTEALVCVTADAVTWWTEDGQRYVTPLPFQVCEVWSMSEGVLLRRLESGSDGLPTLFTLMHPLDDTSPLIIRNDSGGATVLTRPEVTVVGVCRRPSLCLTFDHSTGQHTVWQLCRATADEWWQTNVLPPAALSSTVPGGSTAPGASNTSSSSILHTSAAANISGSVPLGHLPLGSSFTRRRCESVSPAANSRLSLGVSLAPNTRSTRHNASRLNISLPATAQQQQQQQLHQSQQSQQQQHQQQQHHSSLVRSPCVSFCDACYIRLCASPSPARAAAAAALSANNSAVSLPAGPSSLISATPNMSTAAGGATTEQSEPLSGESPHPEVSLQRVWTDSAVFSEPARSAFVTSDVFGVEFVVFVLARVGRLRMVRYEKCVDSGGKKERVCSLVTSVPGCDALPVTNTGTMLVVESGGTLSVYSGVFRLCSVFVPDIAGLPIVPTSSAVSTSTLGVSAPVGDGFTPDSAPPSLQNSPFCPPRRSSLLPGVCMNTSTGANLSFQSLLFPVDRSLHLSPHPANISDVSTVVASSEKRGVLDAEDATGSNSVSPIWLKSIVGDRVILFSVVSDKYITFRLPAPLGLRPVRDSVSYDGGGAAADIGGAAADGRQSADSVDRCLVALTAVLPRQLALELVARCYCARFAPGTRIGCCTEQLKQLFIILLQMMGYNMERLPITAYLSVSSSSSSLSQDCEEPQAKQSLKRSRTNETGSEDWTFLLESEFHRQACVNNTNREVSPAQNIDNSAPGKDDASAYCATDKSGAALQQYRHVIVFALHLVYEDSKLSTLYSLDVPIMARMLHFLSGQLNWPQYVRHYCRDWPELGRPPAQNSSTPPEVNTPRASLRIPATPPDLLRVIHGFSNGATDPYPALNGANTLSTDMIVVCHLIKGGTASSDLLPRLVRSVGVGGRGAASSARASIPSHLQQALGRVMERHSSGSNLHAAVWLLVELGYQQTHICRLPARERVLLLQTVLAVRASPPEDATAPLYRLIGREDRAPSSDSVTADSGSALDTGGCVNGDSSSNTGGDRPTDLDCEPLLERLGSLLWPCDHRQSEARTLLRSDVPCTVHVTPRPELSDHQLLEQQRKQLLAIAQRTMSVSVGRGMMSLHTAPSVVVERLPTVQLCLSGRLPPRGATVDLTDTELPTGSTCWPEFHGGVAIALTVPPHVQHLDAAWILNNRPRTSSTTTSDVCVQHAGVLLGLGLTGHLARLARLNVHDYLVQGHDMTSIGVLLGLAACYRGTMDLDTTKLLSIHVESLLPPTSRELDIPHNVQVAAVLGVGLVYQRTNNRHMAEVLLREMWRPPGPEMENSVDRESYALAAGLALGQVTLGHASDPHGLSSQLHQLIFGGAKPPLSGPQRERYKAVSYHVSEGDTVNTDVTAAGATLALALMYMDSGNRAVAEWLAVPDTDYLLQLLRPDHLQLRVLARCLVLWRQVSNTSEWLLDQLSPVIRQQLRVIEETAAATGGGGVAGSNPATAVNTHYSVSQVTYSVLSGLCLAVGLRYAGTADTDAADLLLHYMDLFLSEWSALESRTSAEPARPSLDNALCVTLTAVSMVMSGTGDLRVMRVCRLLRSRVSVSSSNYGVHMAVHMSLGLLFLSGGRQTVGNWPQAVAALLCAFYPQYPSNSCDNRYHLQAFRHLYVLAAEPRLLIPRQLDTGALVYCYVTVTWLADPPAEGGLVSRRVRAPCLLPRVQSVQRISVSDDRYWTFTITANNGENQQTASNIEQLLRSGGGVFSVKQKTGASLCRQHLSVYLTDKLSGSCKMTWAPQLLMEPADDVGVCRQFRQLIGVDSQLPQLAALQTSCVLAECERLQLSLLQLHLENESSSEQHVDISQSSDAEAVFDDLESFTSDVATRARMSCQSAGYLSDKSLPDFLQPLHVQ